RVLSCVPIFSQISFYPLFRIHPYKKYTPSTKTIAFYLQMNRMRRIFWVSNSKKGEFRVAR
ncbi:hypothetical protein LCB37_RS17465, partial [Escherichia coli]